MDMIISILNSNFFIAVVTLLVGVFAIALYKKQKSDYKKDVALLILQEIRYAEQQVRASRSFSQNAENYPLSSKLLPTNSWYKNIHLFMGDFEQQQIDSISRFYAQVEYIDLVIEKISDYKNSIIEESIVDLSGKTIGREDVLPERVYLKRINNLLLSQGVLREENAIENNNTPVISKSVNGSFNPQQPVMTVNIMDKLKANTILKEVSQKVEFIDNTPIGDRLREIAKRRNLLFFRI